MADLKVTEALIRDVRALQKATASTKIAEGPREAEARQVDDVVQIDVNLRAQQLTETSPPTEKTQEASAISEQAANLLSLLEGHGVGAWASFSDLVADCQLPMEIVGRFLALLELYRARAVAFDQSEPLGVLQISWTGERPSDQPLATAGAG